MANEHEFGPNRILSVGTKVVLRHESRIANTRQNVPAGAVAVITGAPLDQLHHYRVKLPTGGELSLRRSEFSVLREVQSAGLERPAELLEEFQLSEHVIYRCIVGSLAYGLDEDHSDVDRRGIYLPTADAHWSIFGVPEQLEIDETQECYWELQKFLVLALKANPNILECLYTPLVEYATPLATQLLSMRSAFLSQLIYQTYNGYVLSQFKKLEQDVRNHGRIKWKHAMHLIRLLLSGVAALRDGIVPVQVVEHRAELLAIRRGEMPWQELERWRIALHGEFDRAFAETRLPARPEYEKANQFLIEARRSMAVHHRRAP